MPEPKTCISIISTENSVFIAIFVLTQELHAGGMPEPKRASQYQAALLHTMVKDQGVRDDYLNFCECIGCLLPVNSPQHATLREYYSFHALVLTMPLRQLARVLTVV